MQEDDKEKDKENEARHLFSPVVRLPSQ